MNHFKRIDIDFNVEKLQEAYKQVTDIIKFPEDIRLFKPLQIPLQINKEIVIHQLSLTKKPSSKTPDCYFVKRSEDGGYRFADLVTGKINDLKVDTSHGEELGEQEWYEEFIPEFNHTYFKEVYDKLSTIVKLGRVRLIKTYPLSVLEWHNDLENKLHVPIYSNKGARMVIENETMHIPVGQTWWANTYENGHSAFNGGLQERIHLVASVIMDT